MKKISAPVTAFLFTVLLCAQKPFAKNKQALRQTIEKMFDALSDSDSAGLKLLLIEILKTIVWYETRRLNFHLKF